MKKFFFVFLLAMVVSTTAFAYPPKTNAQFGQVWQTVVGNPNEAATEDPNPDTDGDGKDFGPVPECNQIEEKLRSDFGVTVTEGGLGQGGWRQSYGPQNINCSTRQSIYRALTKPAESAGFRQRLKRWNPWTIECWTHTSPNLTSGYVPDSNHLQVRNCNLGQINQQVFAAFLLHETGHVIKNRSRSELYYGFPVSRLASSDPSCYDGLFVKTYSLRTTDPRSESMAEATSLYVYNSKTNFTHGATISNFKSQCADSYKWAKDNVYGGYEF